MKPEHLEQFVDHLRFYVCKREGQEPRKGEPFVTDIVSLTVTETEAVAVLQGPGDGADSLELRYKRGAARQEAPRLDVVKS